MEETNTSLTMVLVYVSKLLSVYKIILLLFQVVPLSVLINSVQQQKQEEQTAPCNDRSCVATCALHYIVQFHLSSV